jgi:predicted dehydrogenase
MLNIGLLGASWIAPQAIIDPASIVAETCIAAVAARDAGRARAYADKYGITDAYGSYEALLADPKLDAVYISLPPSFHAVWAIRALQAGKHVICEKPTAMNFTEAKAMVDAAQIWGKRLIEAFHSRYHPAFETCMDWVNSGAIGQIQSMKAHFGVGFPDDGIKNQYRPEMGGGTIMDMGCYPLHWVRQMAGAPVASADVETTLAGSGVDITMAAQLRFENGATANISSSMHPDTSFDAFLQITGTTGTVNFKNPLVPHQSGTLTKTVDGKTTDAHVSTITTYTYQLQAIATALITGNPLPTEGADLLVQQAEIDRLYAQTGLAHLRETTQPY